VVLRSRRLEADRKGGSIKLLTHSSCRSLGPKPEDNLLQSDPLSVVSDEKQNVEEQLTFSATLALDTFCGTGVGAVGSLVIRGTTLIS
jgi:hypothetical protein